MKSWKNAALLEVTRSSFWITPLTSGIYIGFQMLASILPKWWGQIGQKNYSQKVILLIRDLLSRLNQGVFHLKIVSSKLQKKKKQQNNRKQTNKKNLQNTFLFFQRSYKTWTLRVGSRYS